MLKSKFLVSLVCVFSVLLITGCTETSRTIKSEINGISCDSAVVYHKFKDKLYETYPVMEQRFSDWDRMQEFYAKAYGVNFYDNSVEVSEGDSHKLKGAITFSMNLDWHTIRTIKSELLSTSEIHCSATTTLEAPNLLFGTHQLPSEFEDYKMKVDEIKEKMRVENFSIINGGTISRPIQYKIIVADNGVDFEVEITESGEVMSLVGDIMRMEHVVGIVRAYDEFVKSKI